MSDWLRKEKNLEELRFCILLQVSEGPIENYVWASHPQWAKSTGFSTHPPFLEDLRGQGLPRERLNSGIKRESITLSGKQDKCLSSDSRQKFSSRQKSSSRDIKSWSLLWMSHQIGITERNISMYQGPNNLQGRCNAESEKLEELGLPNTHCRLGLVLEMTLSRTSW